MMLPDSIIMLEFTLIVFIQSNSRMNLFVWLPHRYPKFLLRVGVLSFVFFAH